MQQPDQDVVTYRTMVRLPSGGAVILSASSSQFKHLDAEDAEVVMIVKATALP
jgi:precorrin-4 methylase